MVTRATAALAGLAALCGAAEAGVSAGDVKAAGAQAGLRVGAEEGNAIGFEAPDGSRFLVLLLDMEASLPGAEVLGMLSWYPNAAGHTSSAMNQWNNNEMSQAFIDGDGDGQINLPVFTGGRPNLDAMRDALRVFSTAASKFGTFMGAGGGLATSVSLNAADPDGSMDRASVTARDAALTSKLNRGMSLHEKPRLISVSMSATPADDLTKPRIPASLKEWARN